MILVPERADVPSQVGNSRNFRFAAQPHFPRVGDHLLERRIGGKRIGQAARGAWIGAAKFDRRRRPAALGESGVRVYAGDGAPGDSDGGIEALKRVVAGKRTRSGRWIQQIEIIDPIEVVAPGNRHVHVFPKRERVGEVKAPVRGVTFECYLRVDRIAVAVHSRSVLPGRNADQGQVRKNIGEIGCLRVGHVIAIDESSGGELVPANAWISDPGELPGESVLVQHFFRIDVDAVASAVRAASRRECFREAGPHGKRRIGDAGATGWKARVSGRRENRLLSRRRLIDVIPHHIAVEVGIDRFAANVAIPGIARKSQIVAKGMPRDEIERRGTIGCAIGHRIGTRVIRIEQPVILDAVA